MSKQSRESINEQSVRFVKGRPVIIREANVLTDIRRGEMIPTQLRQDETMDGALADIICDFSIGVDIVVYYDQRKRIIYSDTVAHSDPALESPLQHVDGNVVDAHGDVQLSLSRELRERRVDDKKFISQLEFFGRFRKKDISETQLPGLLEQYEASAKFFVWRKKPVASTDHIGIDTYEVYYIESVDEEDVRASLPENHELVSDVDILGYLELPNTADASESEKMQMIFSHSIFPVVCVRNPNNGKGELKYVCNY